MSWNELKLGIWMTGEGRRGQKLGAADGQILSQMSVFWCSVLFLNQDYLSPEEIWQGLATPLIFTARVGIATGVDLTEAKNATERPALLRAVPLSNEQRSPRCPFSEAGKLWGSVYVNFAPTKLNFLVLHKWGHYDIIIIVRILRQIMQNNNNKSLKHTHWISI